MGSRRFNSGPSASWGSDIAARGEPFPRPEHLAYAPGPTQEAAELTGPILAIFGGADEGFPPAEVAAFDTALTAAGVACQVVVYPDAPHGFFDATANKHAAACPDACSRVLRFLNRRSPAGKR